MIVPDLSKTLKSSEQAAETPEPTPTGTTLLVPVNAYELVLRRRRIDKSSAFFIASGSPGRSIPATSPAIRGLAERQTCASGLTYYACANGFTGCCQGNPCTQTAQCSVEGPTTNGGSSSSTTQSRTSTAQSTRRSTSAANSTGSRTSTGAATTRTNSPSITSAGSSSADTATSTAATSTLTTANATPAPTCPGAPSNFTDRLGLAYQVKCNIDNGGPYNQTIKVNAGGYAQCCSVCSSTRDCVGFTFFGDNGNNTDAGTCYLRSSMSMDEDFNSQSYAVALYKVDPNAVATTSVPSSSADENSGGKSSVGAIAGGVVGGVAALCLLLALFAFLVRRHRKKVDARHAAEKATPLPTRNPVATTAATTSDRYHDHIGGGHHRSGSTANDVYAPQGGFHTPAGEYVATPAAAAASTNKKADHFSELEGHSSTPPGLRAEGGRNLIPAGVLRPPQMLDSRAVGGGKKTGIQAAASRSSVFLEHMSEMEDTSMGRQTYSMTSPYSTTAGDSPILGHSSGSNPSLADETRRRQHLLYWNNYDSSQLSDRDEGGGQMSATLAPRTPPTARTAPGTAEISPDNSGDARDSNFVVSPLRTRKSDHDTSPSNSSMGPRRGTP